MSPELLALLVAVAFIAGFISSMAGAGGLLTLPLLLSAGLPPLTALATNKVQSAMGTLSSSWNFFRRGHIQLSSIKWLLLAALLGSIAGTSAVQRLQSSQLATLLPLLLIAIALYFFYQPPLRESRAARLSSGQFAWLAGLPLGFYGGFFGPASGSILPFLLVTLAGRNLVRATAETKLAILTINGSSALLFIAAGQVNWPLALAMGGAQIAGARLGSNWVMRRGADWVQPIIVVVTLAVAVKLLVAP